MEASPVFVLERSMKLGPLIRVSTARFEGGLEKKKLTKLAAIHSIQPNVLPVYKSGSCTGSPVRQAQRAHQRTAVEKVERPKVVAHNPRTRASLDRKENISTNVQ